MTSQRNIDFSDNNIILNAPVDYDETQLKAIEAAIHNKVLVLTGGPGTDKTTTTLGIISAYREAGAKFFSSLLLAEPQSACLKLLAGKLKLFTDS